MLAINQLPITQLLFSTTALTVRSNGPAGVASINMRGGTAQQTQLFWEGIPLTDPMLGLADLSVMLPLASTIQIHHGPASALLGTGGLGGGIAMATSPMKFDGLMVQLRLSAGTFGRYNGQASISVKNGRWAHATGVAIAYAENNFTFKNTARIGHPTDTMTNSRTRQQGFNHTSTIRLNTRNTIATGMLFLRNDRQLPPLMTNMNNREKMLDDKVLAHLKWERIGQRSDLSMRIAFANSDQTFTQTDTRSFRNVSHVFMGRIGYSYQALRWLTVQARQFTDVSLGYAQSGYGDGKMQQQYGASASVLVSATAKLRAEMSGRIDVIDGQVTPPQLNLGLSYAATGWLKLRASGGTNYRVPTLNDRFWQPGGNANLLPEHGYGGELGFDGSWTGNRTTLIGSATGYYQQIKNLIRWIPGPSFWYPENVGHAQMAGVEASLHSTTKVGKFMLLTNVQYQFSDARSGLMSSNLADALQMTYIPKHQVKGHFQIEAWRTWLRPSVVWVSGRNITTDGTKTLAPFTVLDLQVGHRLPLKDHTLVLMGQLTNLLNQNYQTVAYNPMPGIGFDFTLSYTFNHQRNQKKP